MADLPILPRGYWWFQYTTENTFGMGPMTVTILYRRRWQTLWAKEHVAFDAKFHYDHDWKQDVERWVYQQATQAWKEKTR